MSAPRVAAMDDRRQRRAEVSPPRSSRPRPLASASAASSDAATAATTAAATATTAPASPSSSSSFASAVSGEWDGMLVTFDAASSWGGAEARELPREFVPDAFREWDLSVRDWQTQCSMNAVAAAPAAAAAAAAGGDGEVVSLEYRVRRLLPSVGCEADATAFVDEAVVAGGGGGGNASSSSRGSPSSSPSSAPPLVLATAPDGGYALVPSRISVGDSPTTRVEACLPLAERAPGGGRRRLRLVLFAEAPAAAAAADADAAPSAPSPPLLPASLKTVEVHSETFDSPYCVSGATLSGCGGSVPQFSSKARTAAEELDGFGGGGASLTWAPVVEGDDGAAAATTTSRAFVFSAASASLAPSASPPPARKARGGPPGRLLLPLGSWATLRPSAAPEGGVVFEAGVLISSADDSSSSSSSSSSSPQPRRRRKVMTAAYSGAGELTGVLLATEEAAVGET